MRILLIEPDRELGKTLATALVESGHSVEVKRDAQTGLDSLDEFKPEIVLLELQLGKHNGIEFLYESHSHTDWNSIPVIILTHNNSAQNNEHSKAWKQLGVKNILYKPETSITRLKKMISLASS